MAISYQPTLLDLAKQFRTDKGEHNHYLENYEASFQALRHEKVKLLELGIRHGGSLLLWRDYFENGVIAGLDVNPVAIEDDGGGRVHTFQGLQQDTELLDRLASQVAPEGFDIIIDDCSHIGVLTRESFWHLFENHLKSGGLFVIEDWGTGYWDHWIDGVGYKHGKKNFNRTVYKITRGLARLQQTSTLSRLPLTRSFLRFVKARVAGSEFHSHDFGMVGFVKELIDELGAADIATNSRSPMTTSKFREVRIYPSHLFITKA